MFFLCMWRIMSNEYTVGVVWIWIWKRRYDRWRLNELEFAKIVPNVEERCPTIRWIYQYEIDV